LPAIACLFLGAPAARLTALVATLIDLALGILLWVNYDIGGAQWQFTERAELFAVFDYALGIDGIALMLIMLSVFLMPICILASWQGITRRVGEYMAAFLFMEVLMIGVFAAQDMFLFYIFFEAGLIPMYLIIGVWGGDNRIYASYKFFLYTLLGSVLMLIAMLWMVNVAGTSSIPVLMQFDFAPSAQTWLWLAFFASFAVKMPMWPVHTWLPDAHVQAPTAGSVILAGVLLKLGGYGFIRFSLPMFPEASAQLLWLIFALSAVAVIYTSPRRAGAARHEEADRLFLGRAHGDRHGRAVRLQPAGHRRRDDHDAQPRPGVGRAVPVRRRHLRPAAHARDQPLRRAGDQHAALRPVLPVLHHGVDRSAGDQRLRRRIPVADGRRIRCRPGSRCSARPASSWARRTCSTSTAASPSGRSSRTRFAAMPDLSHREFGCSAPIAAAVLWMGVYPESFIAPMRARYRGARRAACPRGARG
jgi:NADH:ubiquinone oxidoreductase subunit 4 (subunit M)